MKEYFILILHILATASGTVFMFSFQECIVVFVISRFLEQPAFLSFR